MASVQYGRKSGRPPKLLAGGAGFSVEGRCQTIRQIWNGVVGTVMLPPELLIIVT